MPKLRKVLFFIVGLLAIAGVFLIVYRFQKRARLSIVSDIVPVAIDQFAATPTAVIEKSAPEETPKEILPTKFLLSVPFQPQAPFADWSEPYENACEEASIIIAEYYYKNQTLSKEQMKSEIDSAVAWQITNWGGHNDLDATETLKLASDYFHLSGQVVKNYSADDIKKYISSGVPVLAPTAGRKLGNPNFRGAGPEYHMLVIIGYDDSQGIFITNDPGTRNGKNYIYKYQTLLSAISGPNENMAKEIIALAK
ncbi:MAG: C39 family peptidase [Candidatus Berkelbacteria bacterium]|nr:C39 family peptidase [Candidatus Berkelbacteria bacterium]